MSKIKFLTADKILDSRGDWTVKAEVLLDNGLSASASVPQGKSKGRNEAVSLPAEEAVGKIIREIAPALGNMDPEDQKAIDRKIISIDGTPRKSRLGANAILAVSLAVARAGSLSSNLPLWEYLSKIVGSSPRFPHLLSNVINGGVHAGNNLNFQEYLLITKETEPEKSIEVVCSLYHSLKGVLEKRYGPSSASLGDEGGFTPNMEGDTEPFEILKNLVGDGVGLGLDAAASNINKGSKELFETYKEIAAQYPFVYLEDPFPEEDFENFALLKEKIGDKVLVCGDDLTVTNVSRMKKAKEEGSVNAVIIKPNQIGTLTETLEAIGFARENGWKVIVSHRSGETNDSFISDLAYGLGAWGLKLGAPARGERIAKYNRLLEIAKEIE